MKTVIFKLVLLNVLTLLISSCATNLPLGSMPTNENDFLQPYETLKKSYPQIETYKSRSNWMSYCTPISQLTSIWGEPSNIETEWSQVPLITIPIALAAGGGVTPGGLIAVGMGYTMSPKQPQHYYWKKGNYIIDVRVTTDFMCSYDSRIQYWSWTEASNSNYTLKQGPRGPRSAP